MQAQAQTVKAGAEQNQQSALDADLIADAMDDAFQLDQDGDDLGGWRGEGGGL